MAGQCWFVYYDWIPAFEALSPAELGRLAMCALKYSAHGEEPELGGSERYMWPLIKSQIDRDNAKYEETLRKRSAAGKKSHIKSNQMISNDIKCYQEKENKKERENAKGVNRGAFAPPTLEEVKAYVAEKGLSVDPQKFFDYFTVGHWIDSKGNPVKNWKQKLLTWDKKEPQKPAAKPKQYTTAENYTPPKPKLTVEQISALVDKI